MTYQAAVELRTRAFEWGIPPNVLALAARIESRRHADETIDALVALLVKKSRENQADSIQDL